MNAVVEDVKHELAVMDKTGDTKTMWDPRNEEEVEIAREAFNKLKAKGYSIFHVAEDGGKSTRMDRFDPKAAKMIAVPVVVGG